MGIIGDCSFYPDRKELFRKAKQQTSDLSSNEIARRTPEMQRCLLTKYVVYHAHQQLREDRFHHLLSTTGAGSHQLKFNSVIKEKSTPFEKRFKQ